MTDATQRPSTNGASQRSSKRTLRVLMPAPVFDQLREIADARGSTISRVVRDAIGRELFAGEYSDGIEGQQ